MTETLRVAIRGWCAWAPDRSTRAAWQAWAGASAMPDDAPPPALPMMLRRRTSPIGQKLIAAALACGDAAHTARYVLASGHGELARTVGIIDSLRQGELPSPAEFSLSVHHGLVGLLSIHTGNRRGHTAIAAGPDSFGFGLLEAAASVIETPAEPVLLLYADAPMPEDYAPFRTAADEALPLAVALVLGPADGEGEELALRCAPSDGEPPAESTALDFLHFLLSGASQATSRGARLDWVWHRAD
ncbi:3-oxoacyl-ACP synthase [Azospirillum formosense]|uniref:3-oxoacyl-ACP synthase n=1 Tax=Azospirillum formosense TaxID=861533 RepID=A0ABX2KME9_9PROT|nr:beta-ketoacyl synthase chain length factor [Azospirillum formosense]MBY3752290.1 beta-ketoacyl synthase chain length factor [Azospirillum formosense]NUB17814.1 3-oxoacyl-ACP synthase [Azospirillum formosense]